MISATQVQFKREKDSLWEDGLAILTAPGTSDIITLVDAEGQIVPSDGIWDYRRMDSYGAISLHDIA